MPRNRHASKKNSAPAPAYIPEQNNQSQNHANVRINPFAGQDAQTRLIQLLVDSASLAAEPEFLDLEFDQEKTFDVTNRHLKKNSKRLEAASLKGTEAFRQAADDVHIEIATELITADFRIELKKRLQALGERLNLEKNTMKLQMVMALETSLELNTIPISVTGLINQIYNRSMQQALQDYREEKELLEAMKTEFDLSKASPQEVFALLKTPDKLKPIETELVKNPRLMQLLEKQASRLLIDFETELENGRVELELFTREELVLPFQRLQDNLGDAAQFFNVTNNDSQKQVFTVMTDTIAEILTPERWRKFYRDVQEIARQWIQSRHVWGVALHAELGMLNKEDYQQNQFVIFAFFGQLRRLGAPKKSKRSKKRA